MVGSAALGSSARRPPGALRLPSVAIVGSPTRTSDGLAQAWRARGIDVFVLDPDRALELLGPGDVAIVRLDVLPSLDGVEPGLPRLLALEERGVRVLNRPAALLAMHDKLETARVLSSVQLPHPRTVFAGQDMPLDGLPVPGVLKPRFGSWGRDVIRYTSRDELGRAVATLQMRPWWSNAGAVAQELVVAPPRDLRVVVAGCKVAGAVTRVARAGEWRTNVALGARLVPAELPLSAAALACAASAAVGADLAGVDLLESRDGWVVLELNGAVDFDERYAPPGVDLFATIAAALALPIRADGPLQKEEETMVKTVQGQPANVGDVIEITGHAVGDAPRSAEILEVLGGEGHQHFRVRWEDGHESIFFPGDDARVIRPKASRPTKRAKV
jgi:[lysine-biosynthesis-protein LysW]--L-2-aminoadipate ligase